MIYCCYCVHNKHVFLVFDETELWDYGCASILVIHTQTDMAIPPGLMNVGHSPGGRSRLSRTAVVEETAGAVREL